MVKCRLNYSGGKRPLVALNDLSVPRIGRWTVQAELGRGDFATVFRVAGDGTEFALKLCAADSRSARERIERERAALNILSHPHIPHLVDYDEYEGRPYLVMTLGRGKTLRELINDYERRNALFGDVAAMEILEKLLGAVAHVHQNGLVHRDIKEANVLASSSGSSLTLIDFGFCKESGKTEIISSDSFFRVGAARFSPPAKLSNPGHAIPVQDAFAVGVIGYRLLTGVYPWSVSRDEDIGALRDLQLKAHLVPVIERNQHVRPAVSDLITKLLRLRDDDRPSALEALEEVSLFLATARTNPSGAARIKATISYPFVTRDPIHGDIRLTEYECRVLDTREMQRLRYIKQLGLTNYVYGCAEHNRLSHSIGCVARVEQILRTIEQQEGSRVDESLRQVARLYALTHDVTHIAYGHTLEDGFGFFPDTTSMHLGQSVLYSSQAQNSETFYGHMRWVGRRLHYSMSRPTPNRLAL